MAGLSSAASDITGYTRTPRSPHIRGDAHSPISTQSTQDMGGSLFEYPDYINDRSQYEDYSHIQYPSSRKLSMPVAPEPPLRTSSVQSFNSDYIHRSYTTGHSHYHGQNGHYYRTQQNPNHYVGNGGISHNQGGHYNQVPRRRTWTPSGLKIPQGMIHNVSSGNSRNCQSNDLLDAVGDTGYGTGMGLQNADNDVAPPRLAPVSGILPRSPARGLIKPIAFKPVVVNQNYVNTRRMVETRKHSQQDDGYGSQDYPMTNRNVADTSHNSIHMESDRSASFSSDGHSAKHFSPDRPESIRSYQMDSDNSHSTSFSSDSQKQFTSTPERLESIPSSNMSRISASRIEGYAQTPSPSDSGVGELEAMLKEKDAEINTLREVMDKNERAIFQVYEDKKKSWTQEMQELKDSYEHKFKALQHKSYKTEQILSLQVFKLQQEKKTIQEDIDKLKKENEQLCNKLKNNEHETSCLERQLSQVSVKGASASIENVADLQVTVENLNSSLAEKNEENSQLKSELEAKEQELLAKNTEIIEKFKEVEIKNAEVKNLKESLRKMSSEIDIDLDLSQCFRDIDPNSSHSDGPLSPNTSNSSISFTKVPSPRSMSSPRNLVSPSLDKDRQIALLQEQVLRLREDVNAQKDYFEKEKEQWMDEKNKVIRYQKQLQLNYVQMYRKNKLLEAEVEQLTLELESRDIRLMALNGEESVC